ncbi:MAG: hypothetical protein GEU99_19655 [Luteitalea sp.]|nr:hypothetical protein [Luteitalea sp.]
MTALLEVALGVIFAFLLVSLLVTAFTELVAAFTRWRARNLWNAVKAMLGEQSARSLRNHSVVASLGSPSWLGNLAGRLRPESAQGPSYIPAPTLAMVVVDLVLQPHASRQAAVLEIRRAAASVQAMSDPALIANVLTRLAAALPATPSFEDIKTQITHWVADVDNGKLTVPDLVANLRTLAAAAPALGLSDWAVHISELTTIDERLKEALQTLARKAGDDIERFRSEIETWFDAMMKRVSGWYKRKMQAVSFAAALGLACWLDIDTIRIAQVLWLDSTLRQVVVAQAEAFANQPPEELAPPKAVERFEYWTSQLLRTQLPIGRCPAQTDPEADAVGTTDRNGVLEARATQGVTPWWCDDERFKQRPWFLGWLLTALAASLGAPFWFDLLQKVVHIRSSGAPPAKAPNREAETP